jgi:putative transposase
MPRAYSNDLRERLVRAVEGGLSRRQAAKQLEVSVSFAVKLMQRWRARESVAPNQIGGFKRSPLDQHEERVRQLVAQQPEITIAALLENLATSGVETSGSAVARFLLKLGLTRKKRRRGLPSSRARTLPPPAVHGSDGNAE